MKRLSATTKILILLVLFLTLISCESLLNQEATLNVTNESNHIQICVLNGGNIATLQPGETKSRTIQLGSYVIYFTRQNNTICCSAAYFEAKAGHTYGYSCSN